MQGYETTQQRAAHVKALTVELRDLKHAIEIAAEKLKETPEDRKVERAWREDDLEKLRARVPEVEEQLRAFKGSAPRERASRRTSPGETRA